MAHRQNKAPLPTPTQEAISVQLPGKTSKSISASLKLAILLGLIAFVAYINTLNNGYVLDDASVIKQNTIVSKGITAIPEILSTPYRWGFFKSPNDFYRPLSLIMFAVEYQFFGANPTPNHLINIVLFAGCVILLFLFLDSFFERKKTVVAFITALLFALHPIHTEVVANIKSRDELLCFFFAFLCLNIFIKYLQTAKATQLAAGALCFFLSLTAKETSITFLAIMPIIFFFYKKEEKKRSIYIMASVIVAALVFYCIRTVVLNAHNANNISSINFADNELASTILSFESRIATALLILGDYIKLLFVPYPLICDYSFSAIPYVHLGNPLVLLSLSLYLFLIVFSIKRFTKKHNDPFAFSILFFLITISLFSNIPFLIGATMGERFLFFSSVGFCLLIALLIEKFVIAIPEPGIAILKSTKVLAVLIPISLIYIGMTLSRNDDWADNYSLFSADIKKAPDAAKLNELLGVEILRAAEFQKQDPGKQKQMIGDGISYINKALSLVPDFSEVQSDLGTAYFNIGQYDSAEVHSKRALELNPENYTALNNLAGVSYAKKDYPKTIELCKRSIQINPAFANAYANTAISFIHLQQFDSAIYYLKMTAALDPAYPSVNRYISLSYKQIGNLDSAGKYQAMEH